MKKISKFLCMLSTAAITAMTAATVYAEPVIIGDADGNGDVDIYDVIRIAEYMLKPDETTVSDGADCNGDGKIDLYDAIRTAEILIRATDKNTGGEAVAGAVNYNVTRDNVNELELDRETYFSCAEYQPDNSDTVYYCIWGTYVPTERTGPEYSSGKLSGDFYRKADKQTVNYEESSSCYYIKGINENTAVAVKSVKSPDYALYLSSKVISLSKPETLGEVIEAFSLKSELTVNDAYSLTEISSDEDKSDITYEKVKYDIDDEFLWNVLLAYTDAERVSDGYELTEKGGSESIGHSDFLIRTDIDFLAGRPEGYPRPESCIGLNLNGYIYIDVFGFESEWYYIGRERAVYIMEYLVKNYKSTVETVKANEPDYLYYAEPEPYKAPIYKNPFELPQLGDLEKILAVKYDGKNYSRWYYKNCSVPEEKIGKKLTEGTVYGSDCMYVSTPQHKCGSECKAPDRNGKYYENIPASDYIVKGDIYSIKGIPKDYVIAVKSENDPLYLVYINFSCDSEISGNYPDILEIADYLNR